MAVETCSYTLSLGQKAVGSQLLRTDVSGRTTTLEARALFQGVFGQQSLTQTSQLLTGSLESLRFSEEGDGREGKHSFEVVFDAKSGLVRATRRSGSHTEHAEIPYLRPYSDPLGLLHRLRSTVQGKAFGVSQRVPLLGKDVVIEPLGEHEVETAFGPRRAVGFVLYPGPAYVYVDVQAPHTLVRLAQPTQHGLLEAFLTRLVQEDGDLNKASAAEPRPTKRRRRGGRKRRRVEPD